MDVTFSQLNDRTQTISKGNKVLRKNCLQIRTVTISETANIYKIPLAQNLHDVYDLSPYKTAHTQLQWLLFVVFKPKTKNRSIRPPDIVRIQGCAGGKLTQRWTSFEDKLKTQTQNPTVVMALVSLPPPTFAQSPCLYSWWKKLKSIEVAWPLNAQCSNKV